MNQRLDEIYLVKNITLEEIFEVNEIDELIKESCFWTADTEEEQNTEEIVKKLSRFKKNKMKFDRGSLVMKFLSIAVEKLKEKNKVIAKSLQWVKKEIQDSLVSNGRSLYNKRASTSSKADIDLKNIISWIEDPSQYDAGVVKVKKNGGRRETMRNPILEKSRLPFNSQISPQKVSNTIQGISKQRNTDSKLKTDIIDFVGFDESEIKFKKIRNSSSSSEKFIIRYDNDNSISNKPQMYNEDIIQSINSTSFNIFKYDKEVGRENVLSSLAFQIFFNFDLYTVINIEKMESFIEQIKDGYIKSNPYHHDLHAGDVLQTCYSMMIHSNVKDILDTDYIDYISFFIAAIIHDFKHPGLTNGYLVNTKNKLAIDYNGKYNIFINNNRHFCIRELSCK